MSVDSDVYYYEERERRASDSMSRGKVRTRSRCAKGLWENDFGVLFRQRQSGCLRLNILFMAMRYRSPCNANLIDETPIIKHHLLRRRFHVLVVN